MASHGDIPVRVAIRCRPLSSKERRQGCQMCIEVVEGEPQLILGGNHPFTYDHVFSPAVQQALIYETSVHPLIEKIFKGFNVTILAYGQTGSGKTYTMGTDFSGTSDNEDDELLGVIPRALEELFSKIADRDAETFCIKVSFLEIYKEDIVDLLNPSSRKEEVAIREDKDGVKVTGLYEVPVFNTVQALECLQLGSRARTTGSTAMNATSSRSHAIFTICLQNNGAADAMMAKLHFVDLAGSERVKKTKAEGDRFKEGVNINLGLLTLGNVISALSEGRNNHVPYREAKLTRLLQDSLGGNSYTVMIACISPADFNFEETLNTLRYAQRARKIKNKPIVNRDPQAAEVARLKQLVQQLQMQLLQQKSGQASMAETVASIEAKALAIENRRLAEEKEKLTLELQNAIDQTTCLYEKAFMAELARDKMKVKLEELRIKTGIMTNSFSLCVDSANDAHRKEHMEMFQDIKEKIIELQTEHQNAEESLSKCGLEAFVDEINGADNDAESLAQDDCISNEITSEVTLRQAKMNRELQEINKLLAKKEELAGRLVMSDEKINTMKENYEATMRDLETEVMTLQKEKEDLNQALRAVKVNTAYNKVSEQRRKRLQELEGQITDLRRKIVEYSKMAKMKEQSDRKVTRLNEEIQELKHARVRLVRQMRSEAERLRLWKLQKEKEVCKLRQQDRRRQVELVKKEQQFSKQQNVMRIKMEEAMSVNKRLKEALQKQKLSSQQRKQERERTAMLKSRNTTGMDVVKQRIVEWITQELDLVVSAREAKYHLDSLMNDRALISAQLNKLRTRTNKENSSSAGSDSSGCAFGDRETEDKFRQLSNDLELRNVQISDLQQKLLDVEQDEKGGNRFDSLQTMNEAKCALRWLFDTAATDKVDLAIKKSNLQEKVGDYEDAVRTVEATQAQLNDMARNYEEQLHNLKEEQEDKVLYLLAELQKTSVPTPQETETSSETASSTNEDLMKRIKFQEAEIKELSTVREECVKSKQRVKKLETDILELTIATPRKSDFAVPAQPVMARKRVSSMQPKKRLSPEIIAQSSDTEETDDTEKDPDWHLTPLMKRIHKMRSNSQRHMKAALSIDLDRSNDLDDDDEAAFRPPKIKHKRPSEPRCRCHTDCRTKICGCRKVGQRCTENCGCTNCKNRDDSVFENSATNSTITSSTSIYETISTASSVAE